MDSQQVHINNRIEDGDEGFSLNEMFESMQQITETTEVCKAGSFLPGGSREDDRVYDRCHGCGQTAHFVCTNPMKKKILESIKIKEAQIF